MLVRLDPDADATTVMSLPRDLQRRHPRPRAATRSTPPTRTAARSSRAKTVKQLLGGIADQPRRQRQLRWLPRAPSTRSAASTSTSTAATSTTTPPAAVRRDRRRSPATRAVRPRRARLRALPPRGHRPRARRAPAGLPAPGQGADRRQRQALRRPQASCCGSSAATPQTDRACARGRSSRCSSSRLLGQQAGPPGPVPGDHPRPTANDTYLRYRRREAAGRGRSEFLDAARAARVARPSGKRERRERKRRTRARRRASRTRSRPARTRSSRSRARCRSPSTTRSMRDAGGSTYVDHAARATTSATDRRNATRAYRLVVKNGGDRPVLRRPGHDLEGPADPRRPDEDAEARRPQVRAVYYDGNRLRTGRLADQPRPSTGSRTRCHAVAQRTEADARASPRSLKTLRLTARPLAFRRRMGRPRADRRHRHRLRRPRHGGRLRRARQRGLVHRHRRRQDRAPRARRDPDLRAGPRGARRQATASACTSRPTSPTRSSTRGCCSSPSARRRPTPATPTSAPCTRSSTRCRPPTATRSS